MTASPPPNDRASATPHLVSADFVAPCDPALPSLLQGAAVVVTGSIITAVGELAALRRRFGELPRTHLRGLLLPGFVNAHTHLELSYQSAASLPATHFTQWVSAMVAGYPSPEDLPRRIAEATRAGIEASLAAGVCAVGDISRHAALTRPILRDSPLHAVSFGEVVALGRMRHRLEPMLAAAADPTMAAPNLRIGLSPHAPYTVEFPALERIVQAARENHFPLAMHLAELSEEARFLADLSGPLGREWDLMLKFDTIDDAIPTSPGGPIAWAQEAGLLDAARAVPVLLAHVNYCADTDLALLAAGGAAVAYCPRTHAYFGHAAHRYREMLAAGINVALATDSLASTPDLSPLNEARFVYRRDRTSPQVLLEMITANAARALGMEESRGSLTAGKAADFVSFDLPSAADPLAALLQSTDSPSTVYLAGQCVR